MNGITIRTCNPENIPIAGGVQIYNPKYMDVDLTTAIEDSQVLSQYAPYGYSVFLFCKETGTIHCFK